LKPSPVSIEYPGRRVKRDFGRKDRQRRFREEIERKTSPFSLRVTIRGKNRRQAKF
jgi:hypothetical protein